MKLKCSNNDLEFFLYIYELHLSISTACKDINKKKYTNNLRRCYILRPIMAEK